MSDIVYGWPTDKNLNSFDTITLVDQLRALGFDEAKNDGVGNVIVLNDHVGDTDRAIVLALAGHGRKLQISSNGHVLLEVWLADEAALRTAVRNIIETGKIYLRALRVEYV